MLVYNAKQVIIAVLKAEKVQQIIVHCIRLFVDVANKQIRR